MKKGHSLLNIMTSTTTLTKSKISILLCKERCGRAKSRYDKQNDKASNSVGGGGVVVNAFYPSLDAQ